jgi:hypothetical protein
LNLPNFFLADLPPEATLSSGMINEACQTLKRNRERYLAPRSTASLVNMLSNLAENWLEPEFPFRKLALESGVAATGFSHATLSAGLDAFFKRITRESLNALLEQDLGHTRRLDEMTANPAEQKSGRAALVTAPELLVHITAGNIPNPAITSIIHGILVRSAQFVKCATGASLLPRLFAHSLYEIEPKLGACLEIAEWRGGIASLEEALFAETNCLTATGSEETLAAIRPRLPAKVRFLGYGHRVSFGLVMAGSLAAGGGKKIVERAAADVIAWDQLGCLSPHLIYVEEGGAWSAELFAEKLAEELARRETLQPRGALPVEMAAAIASRRSFYEMRAANSADTRMWRSPDSTAWTVVYEASSLFQLSCLHRFIYVKGVRDLADALQGADKVRGHVSTVGLAAPEEQAQALAAELARWGATRVCPLGQMQTPPFTWRHDGRATLAELVTWTDWET